jgi:hypothetical protein
MEREGAMCSGCAGEYENPDLTAPDAEGADGAAGREAVSAASSFRLAQRVPGEGLIQASERLRRALEQLERIESAELELLREAVRVTRLASHALAEVFPAAREREA